MTSLDYLTRDQLRTLCEQRVLSLRGYSVEDAERFDAAVEASWNDSASLAEIAEDLGYVLAEERRQR
jgi:hypothetical protein